MPNIAQRTFSRGEIDPKLNSRVDLAAYFASLGTCRNAFVPRSGGVVNRPGTEFVGEVKDSTKTVRLIPFIFSEDDAYTLEFGNLYVRFIRDGGYVTSTATNIAAISQASTAVVTSTAHGYTNGDEVFISGVVGMTEVNGLVYIVASASANGYQILYKQSGSGVNSTAFTAYSSAGTAARLYTVTTTYAEADLDLLDYAQAQDTIIITHPSYAPRKLVRSAHASWALSTLQFHRYEAPRSMTGTAGVAGGKTYKYKVSAIFLTDGTESLPGTATNSNIASISQASEAVVTLTAHGYSNGDTIRIGGVVGMTQVNEREFTVGSVTTNTFNLLNVSSTGYTAYSSGGVCGRTFITIASAGTPTTTSPNVLTWTVPEYITLTSVTAAALYSIYRESGGIYSLIGTTTDTTFNDTNLTGNAAYSPLTYNEVFLFTGDWPGRCAFYQQRLIFGETTNKPRTFWGSVIGDFYNFSVHYPLEEDDPFEFEMSSNGVTAIRNFVDMRKLILLTDSSESAANGDGSGTITVTQPNIRHYTYNGSTTLKPISINGSAVYVQTQAGIIRDLFFNFGTDGYEGSDLTAWSAHLLDGFEVVDWAYQKIPNSVIWVVRDDGALLSMTYVKEQQIIGWGRHDTDGTVENVCAIPEGTETALYLCIKRTINGGTHRYIERMYSRSVPDATDIRDNVFMDCAETYDGRNTNTAHTVTLTGTTYTTTSTVVATTNYSQFISADVGKYVFVHGVDTAGDPALVRLLIVTVIGATSVSGTPDIAVPTSMQNVAETEFGIGVKTVRGLWHLEAKSVMVAGDGWERANPNMSNSTYATVTVASGIATLSSPHEVIHFGLPYVTQFQTLDIDNPQGQSIMDQAKLVNHTTAYVNNTREFWSGEEFPDDDSQDGLKPSLPQRPSGTYLDAPPELLSEAVTVPLKAIWNKGGRCVIVGVSCYPIEISSICPTFKVGK